MEREIGRLIEIFISPSKGEPMQSVRSLLALAGLGLAGDRYARGLGAYSGSKTMPDNDRQVSLISLQAIHEANRDLLWKGIQFFNPNETRRNLLIDIIPEDLNNLVGKRFLLGSIEMEGASLCDPCTRPGLVLGRETKDAKAFEEAFTGRGGLRARITTGGILTVSDELRLISE